MRAMKDSGVQWIGEIPSTWNRIPLKRWLSSREGGAWGDEATGDGNDVVCIRIADFDYPKLAIKSEGEFTLRHYDEGVIEKLALSDGDILVEKSGGGEKTPVGRAVMHQGFTRALFANFMDRLRILPSQSARYFLYVWTAFYQNGHVNPYIKQTTGIQNLDLTAMLSVVSAPKPDITEQKRIATFLDAKCAQIDAIIEKQRQVIEKLKAYKQSIITEAVTKGLDPTVPMKDSGVEWIGEIPEHWRIVTIKRVAKIIYGLGEPPKLSDDGTPIIRATNIERGKIVPNNLICAKIEDIPSTKDVILKKGDIIVVRSGAYAGDVGYIGEKWDGCIAGYDMLMRVSGANSKFITYAMLSPYILYNQLYLQRIRSAQPHLNAEDIGSSFILAPSKNEQHEIVKMLDNKCMLIESAIFKKQSTIDKLTDYKKSLIYEAVTGNMEV